MSLPNLTGCRIPTSFGPVDTELTVKDWHREYTTTTYKQDVVYVRATGSGSRREGGVVGLVDFTVTVDEYRKMAQAIREKGEA